MFKKENNKSSSSKFKKWRKLQEKRRLEHEKAQHAGRYHPDPGLKMTNSIQKRRLFRKTIPLLTIFGLTALISLYSLSINTLQIVPLPAPDGPDTTNKRPFLSITINISSFQLIY